MGTKLKLIIEHASTQLILFAVFSLSIAICQNSNLALLKDRSMVVLKSEKVSMLLEVLLKMMMTIRGKTTK